MFRVATAFLILNSYIVSIYLCDSSLSHDNSIFHVKMKFRAITKTYMYELITRLHEHFRHHLRYQRFPEKIKLLFFNCKYVNEDSVDFLIPNHLITLYMLTSVRVSISHSIINNTKLACYTEQYSHLYTTFPLYSCCYGMCRHSRSK